MSPFVACNAPTVSTNALVTKASFAGVSPPSPMRTLRGDAKCDSRRFREQMANPVYERFVGVGRPFALMQKLKPGVRP